MTPPLKKKRAPARHTAAFFDFDGTLIDAESQREEALSLLKHHCPSLLYPFRLLTVLAAEPFYKRGRIAPDRYNRIYLSSYRGIPLRQLQHHARTLYNESIGPRLFPEMITLMEAHRRRGHLIIIVSATSTHLLAPFLEAHPPDGWMATPIKTDAQGICTGQPDGTVCIGHEKARAIKRLARALNISLEKSHAYSDHHADMAFLEAVGHPSVINPTPVLKKIAQRRGWKIKSLPPPLFTK